MTYFDGNMTYINYDHYDHKLRYSVITSISYNYIRATDWLNNARVCV